MAAKKKQEKKPEKRVTVVVPRPENITGDTETVVAVNGKMWQIQYNKPVEVPEYVAKVIQNNEQMSAKIAAVEQTITNNEKPFAEFK